jgi:hypothetical protein
MGYLINQNKVVSQIFEDEVIVVNLENGAYYSFRGSAVGMWTRIGSGCDQKQVLSGAEFPEEQEAFLDYLIHEGLITLSESIRDESFVSTDLSGKPEYTKYDDMKDLLLLDPIHEVDVTGWPKKKEDE